MKIEDYKELMESGDPGHIFEGVYPPQEFDSQKKRQLELIKEFQKSFPESSAGGLSIFSSPGRTELGGNHTDHNGGRVLAAGVSLDSIAAALPLEGEEAVFYSSGFGGPFSLSLNSFDPRPEEEGTPVSIVRGIASYFHDHGYKTGGFKAFIQSNVLPGSGLSSSASFEVLIGTVFNHLYNQGGISPLEIAEAGQFAENNFFGKPCGLMDQVACAYGGVLAVDFGTEGGANIEQVVFRFADSGYTLFVVDSGGSHSDLTDDYASVPDEMKSVASFFGAGVLRKVDENQFRKAIPELRRRFGDRPILRALHFFEDNRRVISQIECLKKNDIEGYLSLVRSSGSSSWRLLQNCYPAGNSREQGPALALSLTERFLRDEGACRIHGGGFAGTIQAYIPISRSREYREYIDEIFKDGAALPLSLREKGSIRLL